MSEQKATPIKVSDNELNMVREVYATLTQLYTEYARTRSRFLALEGQFVKKELSLEEKLKDMSAMVFAAHGIKDGDAFVLDIADGVIRPREQ